MLCVSQKVLLTKLISDPGSKRILICFSRRCSDATSSPVTDETHGVFMGGFVTTDANDVFSVESWPF